VHGLVPSFGIDSSVVVSGRGQRVGGRLRWCRAGVRPVLPPGGLASPSVLGQPRFGASVGRFWVSCVAVHGGGGGVLCGLCGSGAASCAIIHCAGLASFELDWGSH